MDGRCATCKWWRPMNGYWSVSQDNRTWGECRFLDVSHHKGRAHPESNAWIVGDGEYEHLRTTPEFGCVQWEPKTDDFPNET